MTEKNDMQFDYKYVPYSRNIKKDFYSSFNFTAVNFPALEISTFGLD